MPKFKKLQTRLIEVYHPDYPEVLLFQAHVEIVNMNNKFVKTIKGIKIEYELKETISN